MTTLDTRFNFDPATERYRCVADGMWVDALPPTQRYRYTVGPKQKVRVGQREFAPGTVLGEGTVTLSYPHSHLCRFDEVEPYDGPDPIGAGHVFSRLQSEQIVAEQIDDE